MSGATAASARVWRRLGAHARSALLSGLSEEELRIILADIARSRATAKSEADLMAAWREDPFLKPSPTDPRALLALEACLWQALPAEFHALDLSPFTALGSVRFLSGTGQNRVVSTMRGQENVYDPVHPLALDAARRRRAGQTRVHLASSQRVAHAWDVAGNPQHETRFAVVSSAPDSGGYGTEVDLAAMHLRFWTNGLLPSSPGIHIEVVTWVDGVAERLEAAGALDHERVRWGDDGPDWRHPFTVAAFRVTDAAGVPLGDGGHVQWTQALTGNRKDRCLVSSVSLDSVLRSR